MPNANGNASVMAVMPCLIQIEKRGGHKEKVSADTPSNPVMEKVKKFIGQVCKVLQI